VRVRADLLVRLFREHRQVGLRQAAVLDPELDRDAEAARVAVKRGLIASIWSSSVVDRLGYIRSPCSADGHYSAAMPRQYGCTQQGGQVMKSILDRSFKYIPSHETDVRKTFERARQERGNTAASKVLPINQARKGLQTA
jgi:hypothetical protein